MNRANYLGFLWTWYLIFIVQKGSWFSLLTHFGAKKARGEAESKSIQKTIMTTWMQMKVKIKSNSIQNAKEVTWMQKRVKIYIRQESQVIKLLTEKGTSENHVCHLHEEKDKIKSNSPWWWPACTGEGWKRNFACFFLVALMIRLDTMARFLQNISIYCWLEHGLFWAKGFSPDSPISSPRQQY